jgi:hypothetical protein
MVEERSYRIAEDRPTVRYPVPSDLRLDEDLFIDYALQTLVHESRLAVIQASRRTHRYSVVVFISLAATIAVGLWHMTLDEGSTAIQVAVMLYLTCFAGLVVAISHWFRQLARLGRLEKAHTDYLALDPIAASDHPSVRNLMRTLLKTGAVVEEVA